VDSSPQAIDESTLCPANTPPLDYDVVIVDAGFAGTAIGACDIPSYLYWLSCDTRYVWPERYAKQPDILHYLHNLIDRYELWPKIVLRRRLDRTVFDNNAFCCASF
jgi:cation diffusion facilitator CzcD-associated flavoprotein CzcO